MTVRAGAGGAGFDTAACNAGEGAVGGGGWATGTDGVLYLSAPTQDTGTPTSWDAGAVGTDDAVTAFAICASP